MKLKNILSTIFIMFLLSLCAHKELMKVQAHEAVDIQEMRDYVVEIKTDDSRGSGVIISKDGLISTNYHVIFNNDNQKHKNSKVGINGETFEFDVVEVDKNRDLAIVKINKKLPFAKIEDLENLRVGMDVYVIGNPLGRDKVVTKGIISGFSIRDSTTYISSDAMINPGNSGGGLFTMDGKLIGIPTYMILIDNETGHTSGLGLSLSSTYLKKYVNR